jgi:hypothetical protein
MNSLDNRFLVFGILFLDKVPPASHHFAVVGRVARDYYDVLKK